MRHDSHVAAYFAANPEKAYAFLNPYVQCRYGRIGVRYKDIEGLLVEVEYVLMSMMYYPYPEGGGWEVERFCTPDEVQLIELIYTLYDISEETIAGVVTPHLILKLGSRRPVVMREQNFEEREGAWDECIALNQRVATRMRVPYRPLFAADTSQAAD